MPPNIESAGAPDIPANKSDGIEPVKPLQPEKVLANIKLAGAPDIPANKSDGIDVKPLNLFSVILKI